jgi:hypothetical protein
VTDHRRLLRILAATAAAGVAIVYFMIGFGFVTVVKVVPNNADMFSFGVPAGCAYLIGVVLLLAFDHRILWVLGVLLQVMTIGMYFAVAPQRDPPFEVWGIVIKIGQVLLLAALASLALPVRVRPGALTASGSRSS